MKKILFENNKNVIWKNVKLYRVKNNLTQSELAAKMQVFGVNLDQQMISKIENNTRFVTDYELACFCIVLKTNPQDLLSLFYDGLNK